MDVYVRYGVGPALLGFSTFLAIVIGFVGPAPTADLDANKWIVVPLKNGINSIDLNGDGVQDMVIKSRRENYNAHGKSIYHFFVELKSSDGATEKWNLVPFTEGSPKERHGLGTHEGADCVLGEIRLVRDTGRLEFPLIVIYADRKLGESYVATETVTFSVYELKHNHEGIPGWPTFYFERRNVTEAKRKYCDVNDAFEKELGLN